MSKPITTELDVRWYCPRCGWHNLDAYDLTAEPTCHKCDHAAEWEQILTPAEQRHYNKLMVELTILPLKKD